MLQQQQEMSATSLSKKTVGDVGDNIHGQDHDNDDGENQNNITALPLMSMPKSGTFSSSYYLDRSKFIPLRLELSERKYLRLLEAALNVSEYTDRIDILSHLNKPKRIVHQIKELCSILSGLVLAADYKIGQELFKNKNFEDNAEFFQDL